MVGFLLIKYVWIYETRVNPKTSLELLQEIFPNQTIPVNLSVQSLHTNTVTVGMAPCMYPPHLPPSDSVLVLSGSQQLMATRPETTLMLAPVV